VVDVAIKISLLRSCIGSVGAQIFIAGDNRNVTSSVRSDIEQQIPQANQTFQLDFAPTELVLFFWVGFYKDLAPPEPFLNNLL